MSNSKVKQNFINWCSQLHPDVNPYLFIHRYTRYSEEYLPLIMDDMTSMHQFIHDNKTNINMSLKGRIKSERSFYIKSFVTMAKNIKAIFDNEVEASERNKMFEKYFKFLLTDDIEKFQELQKLLQTAVSQFDYEDNFRIIFERLSTKEKNQLVSRLGRTEDTFAYRAIVHSVDFPIKSIETSSDSEFYILDNDNNQVPINKAISINPEKDIIYSEDDDKNYITINGKQETLNERNLLYPPNLPPKQRNLKNAQKDENGNLTLLRDSFILADNSHLDIVDIKFNSTNNSVLITSSDGEIRNVSSLLQRSDIKLRKHDEAPLIKEAYTIDCLRQDYYKNHHFQSIKSRRKDYIANPKPETNYMSIHDSAIHTEYGYTQEGQIRTLEMEDIGKDETTRVGHDAYKREKNKKFLENTILAKILFKDPNAFDSSTPTLMEILEKGDAELPEILGKYILTTTISEDTSISYQPPIDIIFNHTFHNANIFSSPSSDDSLPKLDFSSYKNFIASKKIRNQAIEKSSDILDIYDD